jgi:uncharacterized coiled-coil protein SlyX
MQQEIIILQEHYAHQARELRAMSEELYQQQKQIIALERQVEMLITHVRRQQQESGVMRDAAQEMPPPHY